MSDMHAITKRSKVVTIVVLFIFTQMAIVAVLGLNASESQRETTRQNQIFQAAERARDGLSKLRDDALGDLSAQIRDAVQIEQPSRLRQLETRPGPRLVRMIFHIEADGVAHWLTHDEHFRLYMPPDVTKALWERSRAEDQVKRAEEMEREAKDPRKDNAAARDAWYRLLKAYPLRLDESDGETFPLAAGQASTLVEYAMNADPADDQDPRAAFRRALLRALDVGAINRGRPEIDAVDIAILDQIDERVAEALEARKHDVADEELRWEIRRFQAYRDHFRDEAHLNELNLAIRRVQDSDQRGAFFTFPVGTELIAVAPENGGFIVVTLDATQARAIIEARVDRAAFDRDGQEVRVYPTDMPDDAPEGIATQPVKSDAIEFPFNVAVFQVRDPAGEPDRTSEYLIWVMVVLAVLGFGVGGTVLYRLYRREIRLAKLKADFVSNLSHELKTPLTSIQIFTEMFQDGKLSDPKDQAEGFDVLAQESDRLQRIVKRMIDVAHKEARGVAYEMTPGDLNRPILEATSRFRRIVTEPGLDLRVSLAPEPLPMMLDPSAMDDVITNLVSNAWKYKDGDAASITVATQRRGRFAEVVVMDDGIGIPTTERKRVFEMFYRADQYLTQPVAGTGLGLALVRTIVRAHRGKIRVGPGENGKGTAFRMRFPLNKKAAQAAAAPPASGDEPPAASEPEATPAKPEGAATGERART